VYIFLNIGQHFYNLQFLCGCVNVQYYYAYYYYRTSVALVRIWTQSRT